VPSARWLGLLAFGREEPAGYPPWLSDEAIRAQAARKGLLQQSSSQPHSSDIKDRLRIAARLADRLWRKDRRRWIQAQVRAARNFGHHGRLGEIFNFVRRLSGKRRAPIAPKGLIRDEDETLVTDRQDVRDAFASHFSSRLNLSSPVTAVPVPLDPPAPPMAFPPFTFGEVGRVAPELNPHARPDRAGIIPVMLRRGSFQLDKALLTLLNEVRSTLTLPKEWSVATMFPLHKGGPSTRGLNYRPVAAGECASKVLTRLLLRRAEDHAEPLMLPHQFGFRKLRGATDVVGIVRLVQEGCLPCARPVPSPRQARHQAGVRPGAPGFSVAGSADCLWLSPWDDPPYAAAIRELGS
jgi:hypothetical protein